MVTLSEQSDFTAIVTAQARAAKDAARLLYTAPHEKRNAALAALKKQLLQHAPAILQANKADMERGAAKGLSAALLDRLLLDEKRLTALANSLDAIIAQPDPIGQITESWTQPSGIQINAVRVPLGVIGIIYEARPNVTIDAAALCLKAGNACILRAGSESIETARALHAAITAALESEKLPAAAVQLINTTDRAAVGALLQLDQYIDVIIPRGGRGLIERIAAESRIPVIKHLDGLCHTYIDKAASIPMACDVTFNAKMRRTGICGATETLLVHTDAVKTHLPVLLEKLFAAGCEVRGDEALQALDTRVIPATEQDWHTEYLAPILAVRTVASLDAAIAHINHYGSHHTDAIITGDATAAATFQAAVDSGIVLWNTSTQFADGGEFGFGAEIGISTGKLHARGPVGARHLTTVQYRVQSNGAVRPV